jgi:hypothetical protein
MGEYSTPSRRDTKGSGLSAPAAGSVRVRFATDGMGGLFGRLVTDGLAAALRAVLHEFDRSAYCADAHVWVLPEDNGHESDRRRPDRALLVRCPGRRVLVVGHDTLAHELRELLLAGGAGWDLFLLPERQILLEVVEPMLGHRAYNMLTREGFRTVDEVVAAPESALLNIRNLGPKSLAAIQDVSTAYAAGLLHLESESEESYDDAVSDVHGMTTDQLVTLWASTVRELQRRGMLTTCTSPSVSLPGKPPGA